MIYACYLTTFSLQQFFYCLITIQQIIQIVVHCITKTKIQVDISELLYDQILVTLIILNIRFYGHTFACGVFRI